jgi:hypothetical protein
LDLLFAFFGVLLFFHILFQEVIQEKERDKRKRRLHIFSPSALSLLKLERI